ncbi:MAG: histidinol-phosphatase [Saprospiraceae bacterium]|nr:histidinol-phosphatase [Saprospiraceae bacterium]
MLHLFNHHTHTNFSDGQDSLENFVRKAVHLNMITLGFSDHAPIPMTDLVGIAPDQLSVYSQRIDELKKQLENQIQIYKSLEVDYIPGLISVHNPHIVNANLDYTIGAVHYVDGFSDGSFWSFEKSQVIFEQGLEMIFHGDIRQLITRYYTLIDEMVNDHTPDVVAHLDRIKKWNKNNRYFDESEKWYRCILMTTLENIARKGIILEVNTKGFYKKETEDTYPSRWILEMANELKIPTHLASDAHQIDHLRGGFEFGLKQLQKVGYKRTFVMLDDQWQDSKLLEKRIYIY